MNGGGKAPGGCGRILHAGAVLFSRWFWGEIPHAGSIGQNGGVAGRGLSADYLKLGLVAARGSLSGLFPA